MKTNLTGVVTSVMLAFWAIHANAQSAAADGDLVVENAWTRAASASASASTGNDSASIFFTLRNTGQKTIDLIGVRTDIASIETLHRTNLGVTGVARMSAVPELRVAPGASVTLEPGGMHVMLIGLEAPLVEGATLPLRLTFYDGDDLTVEVPILAADAVGPAVPDTASSD
ncbi:copper chaperone PCu(A)C [Alterinioella nitratireducens]|uniref:copper chaperone PCu(A)C n=1 Tax=Alterinioella nitratireducens TaxID=2735915 RepID=UPI001F2B10FF|nr:copper chaperone PCu(A)C [Alterinioella nitratireducens]